MPQLGVVRGSGLVAASPASPREEIFIGFLTSITEIDIAAGTPGDIVSLIYCAAHECVGKLAELEETLEEAPAA